MLFCAVLVYYVLLLFSWAVLLVVMSCCYSGVLDCTGYYVLLLCKLFCDVFAVVQLCCAGLLHDPDGEHQPHDILRHAAHAHGLHLSRQVRN
jgi:hypothetical protein